MPLLTPSQLRRVLKSSGGAGASSLTRNDRFVPSIPEAGGHMFKLIFLVLGLAIGFGGGVYWSAHNPQKAQQLSAQEERRFLEAQMQITQKIQAKLDQLSSKTTSTP